MIAAKWVRVCDSVVQDVEHSLKNMMLGEELEMNNGELAWPLGLFSRCTPRDARTEKIKLNIVTKVEKVWGGILENSETVSII